MLEAGYVPTSIAQYSPDGTEVLAQIVFHICPLCWAMVPSPTTDYPVDFLQTHTEHHLDVARDIDELVTVLKATLPDPPEDSDEDEDDD